MKTITGVIIPITLNKFYERERLTELIQNLPNHFIFCIVVGNNHTGLKYYEQMEKVFPEKLVVLNSYINGNRDSYLTRSGLRYFYYLKRVSKVIIFSKFQVNASRCMNMEDTLVNNPELIVVSTGVEKNDKSSLFKRKIFSFVELKCKLVNKDAFIIKRKHIPVFLKSYFMGKFSYAIFRYNLHKELKNKGVYQSIY